MKLAMKRVGCKDLRKTSQLIRATIFVTLLVLGLCYLSGVVRPNEDRDGAWAAYKRLPKNSVDVLLTGSSKIHANINPLVMWKEAGFYSYDLSGSSMDLTTMYWYLREAYKTQHPKVVVIDILLLGDHTTTLTDVQLRNIMNMPSGFYKMAAVANHHVPASLKEKVLFPYEQYHSRFLQSEAVTSSAYLGNTFRTEAPDIFMGYRYSTATQSLPKIAKVEPLNRARFERHYAELLPTLEFLQKQGCAVLFVNTPSQTEERLQNYEDELMRRLSQRYQNISYYFPRDYQRDFQIDYQTELLDTNHLNAKGAERFSAVLASYLDGRYPHITTRGSSSKISQVFASDYQRYRELKMASGFK